MRFDRDYELVIGIGDKAVVIRPPMRIQFDATKSESGGLNKLNLKVYNLKESTRLKLVKDEEESLKHIPVTLKVGYTGSIESVFIGNLQRGSNDFQGNDFISTLTCLDGGVDVRLSMTNKTVRSKQKALEAILGDMPNTGKGKVALSDQLTRPKVLVGGSYRLLRELADEGQKVYIDNEKINILNNNQVISTFIPKVSARTGLTNTPSRQAKIVTFTTMMNPALKIRGLCELISANAPHLNGVYTLRTINYKGDNEGQDWSMTCEAMLSGEYTT